MTTDGPRRLYRRLLLLAPPALRARHGLEMEEAFIAEWSRARSRRRVFAWAVWFPLVFDLVRARFRRRRSSVVAAGVSFPERTSRMVATELKSALRSFRRQKIATTLVVTMLTLGIAANIVVFSLVNGLFLRPFPFPSPDALVYINEKAPQWNLDRTGINFPDFVQWRTAAQTFDGLALYSGASFNLSDERGAERIDGGNVTHDFLKVLGLQPLRGRMFTADEDRPNGPHVVVISERTWRERFGADEQILGKTMGLNGRPFEIVGVFPKQAAFPNAAALWIPMQGDPNQQGQSYGPSGIGRLKPGVSPEQGDQDLLRAQEPIWTARDKEKVVSPFVLPLRESLVNDFRTIASALWGAVTLLLIVACANVAAVMLARAIARRREMGIRLAIGANRLRLLRQLFIENVVLATIGGIAGIALGRWALKVLVSATDNVLPAWAPFDFDARIVAFSILVTAATSLLFGWAPALHAVKGDLRTAMGDTTGGGGATVSPRGRRTLTWLVAAEFTLAAVLLAGGALFLRAFIQVQRVDPGYRADHAMTFSIALPAASYVDGTKRMAFWDRLLERLRATAGIEAAGIITCPPLTCHWGNFYRIEGRPPLKPGESNPVVLTRIATAGYFEAVGLRLKAGRFFAEQDGRAAQKAEADAAAEAQKLAAARPAGTPAPPQAPPPAAERSVIVNEMFVKTFWPGLRPEEAIGKRLSYNSATAPWIDVVGVTADVKHYGLERPMRPGLYFPAPQQTQSVNSMAVVVRTTGEPDAITSTVRHLVREMDATLPLYRVQTLERMLTNSTRTRATYSWMLAVFAGLALVLALGGAYGVTSYLVTQRTREIGIRMAMGARSRDIVRSVLQGSLVAIGIGVVVGLATLVALAGLLKEILFGVSPNDPVVLAGATLALALAAVLANWLPARRAAKTDPMTSLRY